MEDVALCSRIPCSCDFKGIYRTCNAEKVVHIVVLGSIFNLTCQFLCKIGVH